MPNIPWAATTDEFDQYWEGEDSIQEVPDILETMFRQQLKHMQAYAMINEEAQLQPTLWGDLNSPDTQASLREFAGYTVEEFYEAINHLKNKPWKQTRKPTDAAAFKEELADMWHFLIEFHILAGITPTEIFKEYFRKALVNEQRQVSGY